MAEKIAEVLQANLADELTVRGAVSASVAGAALVQTTDSSGNPVITVGSALAGQDYAYIRIVQESTLRTDALGLNQRVYAPTKIQIALETSTVANVPQPTISFMDALDSATKKWGAKVEKYLSSHGVVPSVSTITGTPAVSSYPHPYDPLRAQT